MDLIQPTFLRQEMEGLKAQYSRAFYRFNVTNFCFKKNDKYNLKSDFGMNLKGEFTNFHQVSWRFVSIEDLK